MIRSRARPSALRTAASPSTRGSVWAVFGDSTLARLDAAGQSRRRDAGRDAAGGLASPQRLRSGWRTPATRPSSGSAPRRSREGPSPDVQRRAAGPTGIACGERRDLGRERGRRRRHAHRPELAAPRSRSRWATARRQSRVGAGAVWVANDGREPSRGSTRATNEVVATIDVGNGPPASPSATASSGSPCRRREAPLLEADRGQVEHRVAARCSRRASTRASAR